MNNKTIKKWFSMLLLMLVAGVGSAVAQSLTIADFAIAAGETKDVAITLTPDEGQTIYGVQTDVTLSEGLTLNNATSVDADLNLSRNEANNRLILLSLGSSQKTIAAGDVITLSITAADNFESGTITLANSRITVSNTGDEVKVNNSVATVTVETAFEPVDCTAKVSTDNWLSEQGSVGGPVTLGGIAQKEQYNDHTTADCDGDVLYQVVESLENGTYTVELYANASFTSGRGFTSDITGGELGRVLVYAGDVAKTIPVFDQTWVTTNNVVVLENVVVSDGTLRMGLYKIAPGTNWHTIQIKSLTQTSDKAEADEAAQDTYWTGIAATIAAYEAYSNVGGVERANLTGAETKADVQSAIPPFYDAKTAYDNLAQAIADAEALGVDATDAKAVLNGAETTAADAEDALHLVKLAVNTKAVEGASEDNPIETDFVVNGTFDTAGVTAPWKTTTGAQNQTTANNQSGAFGVTDSYFFENWNPSNYTGKIYQEIEDIPNGMYELSICAFVNTFSEGNQYVYANADKTMLTTGTPTAYTVKAIVTNNKIEVGFEQTAAVNGWSGIDNVKLTYLGEVKLEDLVSTYETLKSQADELAASKMTSEALAALQAANVEVDKTDASALIAAIDALTPAVQNANTSANAYADAANAIAAAKALKEAHNFTSETAATTFADAIAAIETPYNEGTLSNDDATKAGLTLGVAISGWHANANSAAVAYMNDGFSLDAFTQNLYVNTWSSEGETDGTNFKVPFYEYWTGNGNSLAAETWTGALTDLPNGLYSISAWVRVRAKDGTTAADATGISINVNGGEAVDATEGTQVGDSQFQIAEYTAEGLVKDGTLNLNFIIGSDNNISWLSFKNVKYEKVRDLTEEEAGFDEAKQELSDAIAAAKEIDTTDKIGVEDLTAAIETAEAALNDAEATYTSLKAAKSALDQAIEAFELANKPFSIDDYLVNADFSSTGGWTAYTKGNHDEGNGLIGEYKVRSEFSASTIDETHLSTEYCLAVEARWQTNYSSFNQETTRELPVGVYKLTYDVQNVNSGTTPAAYDNMFYVQVGDQKYTDSSTEWMSGATSWTAHSITFRIEEAATAKVSFGYGTGSNNYALANTPALYVSHLNLESLELATADDYAQMDGAIADAEAKAMGFEAGEYAPYKNIEPLALLAAAKAIDRTVMNAKEDVLRLGDAAWVVNEEEVNGIYDGDFAIQTVPSVNTRPIGWSRNSATANTNNGSDGGYETRLITLVSGVSASGKGMMTKFHAFYGDQQGYELPLKANTSYTLSFKYCGYNNSPTMHINVYGEDGTKVANSDNFSAKDSKGHETADSWQEFSYTFKTAEAGNYVIGIIKNTGGTEQNQGGFTDITLVKAPLTPVTLAVTDAQYATFVAPFDVAIADIPEGVTAYTVDDVDEDDVLQMTAVTTTIPANTPVVLYSENVVSTEVSGVADPAENLTYGILTGVYAETAVPSGSYVLQNHEGTVAFYVVDTEVAQPKVQANHAYMTISSGDGARAYYFGGATAISALKALTDGDGEIYDLNGRRQTKLQKGVNIVKTKDGRTQKVMVK